MKKQIVIYNSRRDDDPPGSLRKFVAWANGLLALVPPEALDSATVEFEVETEYGDAYWRVSAFYEREMTPEEEEAARETQREVALRELEVARKIVARLETIVARR